MTTHLMSTQSVQQPVSRTRRFFRAVGRGFKAAGILAAGLMTAGGAVAACRDVVNNGYDASMGDAQTDMRSSQKNGQKDGDMEGDAVGKDAETDAMPNDMETPKPVLRVVLARATKGGFNLSLLEEDGSLTPLTSGVGVNDLHPTWCIEGGVVTAVFESDREGSMRLFKIEIDLSASPPVATEPVALTDGSTVDQNPQCSNSGRVFYVCGENLCSIHLDASGLTVVFSNAAYTFKRSPSVSDAEDLMAFSAEFPAGSAPAVFRVNLEEGVAVGEAVRVTPEGASASSPSISPSGEQVALNLPMDGIQVATIPIEGGKFTVLTTSGTNGTPRFVRPGGDAIFFHSDVEGGVNVFSVTADGSMEPVNLSTDPTADYRTPEGHLFPR